MMLVNIDAGDIMVGNGKLISGLIWKLILRYQVTTILISNVNMKVYNWPCIGVSPAFDTILWCPRGEQGPDLRKIFLRYRVRTLTNRIQASEHNMP
jgi:hypothetical protein